LIPIFRLIEMNYFAKNLTYCRKAFGITQAELANRLEKSQSTVAGWENKVSEPNVESLIKFSEIFGISIDHLIKTDLPAGQYITEEHIQKFKDSNSGLGSAVSDAPVFIGFDEDLDHSKSHVNEDEPVKEWTILKVLKEMDQKLDKLLLTDGRKP
jgi:transcriptional regulator with XRE-family HTH domain